MDVKKTNISLIKLFCLLSIVPLLLLLGSFLYEGMQYQKAAEHFWGDQYQPEKSNSSISWGSGVKGFILDFIIPDGGPLISTQIAGLCPSTPLPVVPLSFNSDGTGYVLCGIGTKTIVTAFNVNDIEDEGLMDALRNAFKSEFTDSE